MAASSDSDSHWWHGQGGGREVLIVALPLVVSSLSWTIMTFVDRVFLKWLSGTAMAAAFAASASWFCLLCLPLGICAYANTFVAQYCGDRRPERVGPSVWTGVWVALAFTPLTAVAIPLAPTIFAWAGHSPAAWSYETAYFQILCVGIPAMLVSQSLAAFYSGRGLTRVVMWVDAFFALVNVLLDYLWIFGHAGFPALGIEGAGWATVVSLYLKAATYLYLVLQPRHRDEFATLTGLRFDRELFQRFLYYGGPSGIQMLLDVLGFTVFVMLVGRLGSVEYEATSMAFSISTLGFMPILGLGLAASILVGHRLGENRDDLAARSTWTTLWISWAYMAGVSLLYVVVPGMFLFWFFAGSNEADSATEETWQLSVKLLRFVAAYNLLDATLIIFVSAIKGAGDTRFVLQVSLIMSALLAGLSWLCVEVLQLGVYGCWSLITAWVCLLGIIFWWRFVQGKWRTMRVIEQRSGQPLMETELATAEST